MTEIQAGAKIAPENTRSTLPDEPTDEQLVAGLSPAEVLAGPGASALRRTWRRLVGRDPETGLPFPPADDVHPAEPDHPDDGDPAPAVRTAPAAPPVAEPRRVNEWAHRRKAASAPNRTVRQPAPDRSRWAIAGVVVLGLLVLAIVAVGLYTSLGALRDTGMAAHIEPSAANLWWIGIDGLIVVAIVAVVILRHDPVARRYALGVVVVFTAASGFLQFLHGLGWTTQTARSGEPSSLPWPVVGVIAVLIIGTIFCGTHLLVYVLRHLFPRTLADQEILPDPVALEAAAEIEVAPGTETDTGDGSGNEGRSDESSIPGLDAEAARELRKRFAAIAVELLMDAGVKPVRAKIARSFEIADRQAGYVISDVTADREDAEALRARVSQMRADALLTDDAFTRPNGSGDRGRSEGSSS